MLRLGQRLKTRSGSPCVVEALLGSGGQGAVYRALTENIPVALKWYFQEWRALDAGLRVRLEAIVAAGSPSDRFLWPIDLVLGNAGQFGYVMPLRDPGYESMTALLGGRTTPSFATVIMASLELAHSFHLLHAEGLSYQDVNDRNVWFHPETGAIQICDVDNVSVNGVPGAVSGTPGYIAPEIVLRTVPGPSAETDRHSLAVLIFLMLMLDDPLLGAAELHHRVLTPAALRALYVERPVFVFDPNDASNRPVPGRHDRVLQHWPLYPGFIRDLFVRAFTDGLRTPAARPRLSDWRRELCRLRDSLLRCSDCGAENFFDEARAMGSNCWNCSTDLLEPMLLELGDDRVVLNINTTLYEHHLDPRHRFEFTRALARISRHPTQRSLYGIANDSGVAWHVTRRNGTIMNIPPRHVAGLEVGMQIDFGFKRGKVVDRAAVAT